MCIYVWYQIIQKGRHTHRGIGDFLQIQPISIENTKFATSSTLLFIHFTII